MRRRPAHRRPWLFGRKRPTTIHVGATERWSPAAELAAVGAGVLDPHPDRPEMGSEADREFWSARFGEIQTGHQAAIDELFDGIVAAAGWDPEEFNAGYVEIVSARAWIDHDVTDATGIEVPPSPPVAVGLRLTAAQARRARKREHRALGELVRA